jgi:PAS domain S-box-containing protein
MISQENFPRLPTQTPVLFHSMDSSYQLVEVSNHWLQALGYERAEVIGQSCTEFFTGESRRHAEEVVLPEYSKRGFCTDVPCRIVAKSGKIMDVLFSATAELNEAGEVAGSLAVWTDVTGQISDITERKRAAEEIEVLHTDLAARAYELEIANEELEAFSYTVSHDLRKPLTAISGYCQMIHELCGGRLDQECEDFIVQILNGTERMNQLIDTLLEFSRVTHSKIHRGTVDLSRLAGQVAEEFQRSEPQRQVCFQIAQGLTAQGDPDLLRVVLENLIGNAWKYSSGNETAHIEFGASEISGKRAYYVRDDGVGFEAASAQRVFTPFERLPGGQQFKGFGIGLATVKRIIKSHGGRVWAEGEAGKGAVFHFTLG